jgi:hypothetical protein
LKISSLHNFSSKSPNIIFIRYLETWSAACSNSHNTLFWIIIVSSLGSCTFKRMVLLQRPLWTIHYILSLRNSTILTADTIL